MLSALCPRPRIPFSLGRTWSRPVCATPTFRPARIPKPTKPPCLYAHCSQGSNGSEAVRPTQPEHSLLRNETLGPRDPSASLKGGELQAPSSACASVGSATEDGADADDDLSGSEKGEAKSARAALDKSPAAACEGADARVHEKAGAGAGAGGGGGGEGYAATGAGGAGPGAGAAAGADAAAAAGVGASAAAGAAAGAGVGAAAAAAAAGAGAGAGVAAAAGADADAHDAALDLSQWPCTDEPAPPGCFVPRLPLRCVPRCNVGSAIASKLLMQRKPVILVAPEANNGKHEQRSLAAAA
eukprot:2923115-Pleurochrysis_carterae.AAC.1